MQKYTLDKYTLERASSPVHHPRCITLSVSPPVHHPQCITPGASPPVHHPRCITPGASSPVHHPRCIITFHLSLRATRDWKSESVTDQPNNQLTWVGARDTCVSKKKRVNCEHYKTHKNSKTNENCVLVKQENLIIEALIVAIVVTQQELKLAWCKFYLVLRFSDEQITQFWIFHVIGFLVNGTPFS